MDCGTCVCTPRTASIFADPFGKVHRRSNSSRSSYRPGRRGRIAVQKSARSWSAAASGSATSRCNACGKIPILRCMLEGADVRRRARAGFSPYHKRSAEFDAILCTPLHGMPEAQWMTVMALGFLLGARHGLDADHVAAVATLLSHLSSPPPRTPLPGPRSGSAVCPVAGSHGSRGTQGES